MVVNNYQPLICFATKVMVITITTIQRYSRMGWAPVSNKMPGCHLANAWRNRSKHILQWQYYTAMKYQFNSIQLLINWATIEYWIELNWIEYWNIEQQNITIKCVVEIQFISKGLLQDMKDINNILNPAFCSIVLRPTCLGHVDAWSILQVQTGWHTLPRFSWNVSNCNRLIATPFFVQPKISLVIQSGRRLIRQFPQAIPAFRKRLKHHLFSSAFPGNSSPSTGITFCDVSPSTDATQVRYTPLPG